MSVRLKVNPIACEAHGMCAEVLPERITLDDYQGPIRQIAITDFGHEKPTLLLTNQLRRSAPSLIEFYARRMLIENSIADSVEFFHIDALSSAVALKINCDLQLTLMASSLYRLLGAKIGKEYTTADSSHLFRDFIEAHAVVTITDNTVEVAFGKRAHSPLLLATGFQNTQTFDFGDRFWRDGFGLGWGHGGTRIDAVYQTGNDSAADVYGDALQTSGGFVQVRQELSARMFALARWDATQDATFARSVTYGAGYRFSRNTRLTLFDTGERDFTGRLIHVVSSSFLFAL